MKFIQEHLITIIMFAAISAITAVYAEPLSHFTNGRMPVFFIPMIYLGLISIAFNKMRIQPPELPLEPSLKAIKVSSILGGLCIIGMQIDFILHQSFIWLPYLFGVLCLVLGSYYPKTKRNGVFGVRTAWTLSSDENWMKTHRFMGKLCMIMGSFLILMAIFSIGTSMIYVWMVIAPTILGSMYSYLIAKKQSKAHNAMDK